MVKTLTPKMVAYCLSKEGMSLESYKDTEGVWTWAGGITNSSGMDVSKYIDNPSGLMTALKATISLVETEYLPEVLNTFKTELSEAQLSAALSFHWNTGCIKTADWVHEFNDGNIQAADHDIMNWSNHSMLIARRSSEQELFFDNVWPVDLKCTIYSVRKPAYTPSYGIPTNILPTLSTIMGISLDPIYTVGTFRVNADTLNIRSGPGILFPVTRTLKRGDSITVANTVDPMWDRIKDSGEFISSKFLDKT